MSNDATPPNRAARRAEKSRRGKDRSAGAALPISRRDLDAIGARATETVQAAMLSYLGCWTGDPSDVLLRQTDASGNVVTTPGGAIGTAYIPFFAVLDLADRGIPARVVAGSAMWSLGRGRSDVLSHGCEESFGPEWDAQNGNYHVWLEIDGFIVDVTARLLPTKFAYAAGEVPIGASLQRWHKFPDTIIHPLGRPMSDPRKRSGPAYGYAPGSNDLTRLAFDNCLSMAAQVRASHRDTSAP